MAEPRNLTVTLTCLGLSTAASVWALPQSPIDPTYEDCRMLSVELYKLVKPQSEQLLACLKGPLGKLLDTYECSYLTNTVHPSRGFWVQCSNIEVELCRLLDYKDRQEKECYAICLAEDPVASRWSLQKW